MRQARGTMLDSSGFRTDERQPVAHADESERGGEHEDRREGDPCV